MRRAILLALLASCDRQPPIARCTDDLAGVYEIDGRRWNALDNRRGLEIYPLFDDGLAVPGLETAPRAIDLRRISADALAGEVTRRFMQGTLRCDAKASARVVSCKDDTLEIVLADPVQPIAFEPCAYGQSAPSRRERWRRVR